MALVNANYNNYDNCGAWPRSNARRWLVPARTTLFINYARLINIPGRTRANDWSIGRNRFRLAFVSTNDAFNARIIGIKFPSEMLKQKVQKIFIAQKGTRAFICVFYEGSFKSPKIYCFMSIKRSTKIFKWSFRPFLVVLGLNAFLTLVSLQARWIYRRSQCKICGRETIDNICELPFVYFAKYYSSL